MSLFGAAVFFAFIYIVRQQNEIQERLDAAEEAREQAEHEELLRKWGHP